MCGQRLIFTRKTGMPTLAPTEPPVRAGQWKKDGGVATEARGLEVFVKDFEVFSLWASVCCPE